MEIEEVKAGDILLIGLKGRLDSNTSGSLEQKLLALIEGGQKQFIIDFCNLEYISSAGLRVLLLAAKRSKAAKGKIVLSSLKTHIKEVFDLAGFSPIFPICQTREEALSTFNNGLTSN